MDLETLIVISMQTFYIKPALSRNLRYALSHKHVDICHCVFENYSHQNSSPKICFSSIKNKIHMDLRRTAYIFRRDSFFCSMATQIWLVCCAVSRIVHYKTTVASIMVGNIRDVGPHGFLHVSLPTRAPAWPDCQCAGSVQSIWAPQRRDRPECYLPLWS